MQRLFGLCSTIGAISLALAGCGDNTDTSAAGGSGGQGGEAGGAVTTGGSGGVGGMAAGGRGGSGAVEVPVDLSDYSYAMEQLFLGDTDRDGTPSASAWQQYGLNIDGLISTANDTNLCQPYNATAPAAVYPDGDNGIDNSFGKNLIPIITGLFGDALGVINTTIQSGGWSYLIWADGLGLDPNQSNLPVRGFNAAPLGQMPAWDLRDPWRITAESLAAPPDVNSAISSWADSTLSNQILTTGPAGAIDLNIEIAGVGFPLNIRQARLSAELSADRTAASLGVMGGVIEVEEMVEVFRQLLGAFDMNLCSGSTFESLAEQVRRAADILVDGTQDPNQTCNAISIGVGFEAVQANIVSIVPPVPPPFKPCGDG